MMAMNPLIPQKTITYNSAIGMYGFSVRFPGRPAHYEMQTFTSLENVLAWTDPQKEHIWEEPSTADESKLLVGISSKRP
jgi:hypothetical protein